jgi:hypothetical protein
MCVTKPTYYPKDVSPELVGQLASISAQRHVRVGLPQFMPGSGPKMNEKCRAGTTLRCRWAQSVAEK